MDDLQRAMAVTAEKVTTTLDTLLPMKDTPDNRVTEAMRYATLGGGKRVRPFLVMQSAGLFNVDPARAVRAAAVA